MWFYIAGRPIFSRLDSKVTSTNKMSTTLAVIFVLLASVFILDSFSWSLVYRTSYGSLDSTPKQNESDDGR
jgi:hypothetical protein